VTTDNITALESLNKLLLQSKVANDITAEIRVTKAKELLEKRINDEKVVVVSFLYTGIIMV
jgi:hypothetical protein